MAIPIGIRIPIAMGNTGYFQQTFSSLEEAKSNLLNLLLTKKGERIMQPDFGTDIYNRLFDQNTYDLGPKIKQDVEEAIKTWLPYVEIFNIDVDASQENIDSNKIKIAISFGLKRDLKLYDEIQIVFQV